MRQDSPSSRRWGGYRSTRSGLTIAVMMLSIIGWATAWTGVAHAADPSSPNPIVSLIPSRSGLGYWQVASDGAVYGFGDAKYFGGANSLRLRQPIVGGARHPAGAGYWLVGADGGVFAYGDSRFFGSAAEIVLNEPIVGIAATPSGNGYWLVASDGGIFAYGDAKFLGSTGNIKLNQPVVGMAATPSGNGYWLVALDGGVFAYGDARFYGRVAYTPPAKSGYSYLLPRNAAPRSALSAPHHDYPALDIPVPSGTPFYALTAGTVTRVDQPTGCGYGYILQGNDSTQYTYCHASKYVAGNNVKVTAGQQLGLSGNSGHSTGAHLHIQIRYAVLRCPQSMITAVFDGKAPPSASSLPTSGCIS